MIIQHLQYNYLFQETSELPLLVVILNLLLDLNVNLQVSAASETNHFSRLTTSTKFMLYYFEAAEFNAINPYKDVVG